MTKDEKRRFADRIYIELGIDLRTSGMDRLLEIIEEKFIEFTPYAKPPKLCEKCGSRWYTCCKCIVKGVE